MNIITRTSFQNTALTLSKQTISLDLAILPHSINNKKKQKYSKLKKKKKKKTVKTIFYFMIIKYIIEFIR